MEPWDKPMSTANDRDEPMALPLLPGYSHESNFNPVEEPDGALQLYNRVKPDVSADPLLMDYIQDQAEVNTCVLDIETTRLIDRLVPFADMTVSVASVLLVEDSTLLTFWQDERTQRGAPLRFLTHLLDHAYRVVAYNGNFDLSVLGQGDTVRVARWKAKLFDPFAVLYREFGIMFKLASLLNENGLGAKTASGAEAPRMWQRWLQSGDARELIRLEEYNQKDVELLSKLIQLERVWLPGGGSTNSLRLRLYSSKKNFEANSDTPTNPEALVQGSAAWLEYRKHKISASTAAAFLRLDFRTTREEQFERLLGEVDGPRETTAMKRGLQREDGICRMYADAVNAEVSTTGSWPHPEFGNWLFASPDRLVWHPQLRKMGLLEAKSVSRLTDGVPAAHLIQCQLQLACVPQAVFVDHAQSDGVQIVVHRVRRDSELIGAIVELLRDVYEAARPALEGDHAAEDVFVDDVEEFGRDKQQELAVLLDECRKVFVSAVFL